ncbi:MAG: ice-binding family protein, partial [Deltaproteobacteria bacterium]|nr:ice-binding family protein [Deltaproteobacteria bacterium]
SGGPNDVWIFQIAGDLTQANGKSVNLAGGAQAKNIFWQVSGGTGVTIGTTAHLEGTILAAKAINLNTGASVNGRLLAQTAVALDHNTVVKP